MSPPKRLRRFARLPFFAGLILFLGLVAVYLFENCCGQRTWEIYRAEALRRGTKLDIRSFFPPKVPDAENFAAIPFFQDLFAGKTHRFPGECLSDFQTRVFPGTNISTNHPLRYARSLAAWNEGFVREGWITEITDQPGRDFLRALERYEPALQQIRDASERPRCFYPQDWENFPSNRVPVEGPIQEATLLFALRMRAQLALGHSSDALQDYRYGLRLYRSMENEPLLIDGLVRMALLQILIKSVHEGLSDHRWAEPELHALAESLSQVHPLEDCLHVLRGERASCNFVFDQLALHPDGASIYTSHLGGFGIRYDTGINFPSDFFRLYPRGWIRAAQVRTNESFDGVIQDIDPERGVAGTFIPNVDLSQENKFNRIRLETSYAICPPLFPAVDRFFSTHTVVQQAKTACLLELYWRSHGSFPERLEEGKLFPSLPIDVCSGEPLHYHRILEGYWLWSIGSNRRDDGGLYDPRETPDHQLDWIWEIP
jgi:hypothetical protein